MHVGDEAVLALQGVRKRFARRGPWVLDGIDLTLPPGSTTVVAGGNGSGKSTLLRIAAGASRPSTGHVTTGAGSRSATGYVPERLPARLQLTATDYLAHMARLRGLPGREAATRSRVLLRRLGLRPGPDVPVGSLSKGNSQKVALTQAFLAPAGLLVLDEPFSGLDGPARGELTSLLTEARAQGSAILASAHHPRAGIGADATFLLADGRLTAADPAAATVRTMRLVLRDPDGRQVTMRTDDADALLTRLLPLRWSLLDARAEAEESR